MCVYTIAIAVLDLFPPMPDVSMNCMINPQSPNDNSNTHWNAEAGQAKWIAGCPISAIGATRRAAVLTMVDHTEK
jgi:hypothetical protein